MTITLADQSDPACLVFADDGRIPNSRLPVLLYRGVLNARSRDMAAAFEELFAAHDWHGAWRDGIYPFHHFHSTTHEVLGVARGWVEVRLGGEAGASLRLEAGDVVVIPAGVGHKHERSSASFLVVGAYPEGRDWDVCRGEPGDRARALTNLAVVPLPTTDPVHGAAGPLRAAWSATRPAGERRNQEGRQVCPHPNPPPLREGGSF
jgi:uncharacterized protein YjlB